MITAEFLIAELSRYGCSFYSGVPDSYLKALSTFLLNKPSGIKHYIAANEGNAVALGIGSYLANGNIPVIYMQNSGLGNAINPLVSIADELVYGIPMLLIIGWRGQPGKKDEPQHIKQGICTSNILEILDIPTKIVTKNTNDDEIRKTIDITFRSLRNLQRPHALIFEKNVFYEEEDTRPSRNSPSLISRRDAIEAIIKKLPKNSICISSTGYISREILKFRNTCNLYHGTDFYCVGGMGHANQIACAVSLERPHNQVYCIDGDGALLMHLGSLATNASISGNNFIHILFNNGVHDSVGGQPISAPSCDFSNLASSLGYENTAKINGITELENIMQEASLSLGNYFIEVMVAPSDDNTLPRPDNLASLKTSIREKFDN